MSAGEIIIIFIVYLLFFGSKGLPALAQTMGKAVYQFRNAAGEVQREIMSGVNEVKKQAEVRLDQEDVERPSVPQSAVPQGQSPVSDPTASEQSAGTTSDQPKES